MKLLVGYYLNFLLIKWHKLLTSAIRLFFLFYFLCWPACLVCSLTSSYPALSSVFAGKSLDLFSLKLLVLPLWKGFSVLRLQQPWLLLSSISGRYLPVYRANVAWQVRSQWKWLSSAIATLILIFSDEGWMILSLLHLYSSIHSDIVSNLPSHPEVYF